QASGTLSIAPTYFSGRLRLPSGRNLLKRITAEAVSATVKPAPPGYSGALWLPAEKIEIEEVWPAKTLVFEQGVPITRTLIVRATGLSSAQLPQLEWLPADGIRMYPDQPATEDRLVDSGVLGVRTESVALVPQTTGELTLPEVTLTWWDTVNNREQVARVPAREIRIAPSALTQTQTQTAPGVESAAAPAVSTSSDTRVNSWTNPWLWATFLCATGWLLTLWRRPAGGDQTGLQDSRDSAAREQHQELRTRLRLACRSNDAHECRRLVYRYIGGLAGDHDRGPALIGQIESRYGPELAAAVKDLSRRLYGPDADGDWRGGAELWTLLVRAEKQTRKPQEHTRETLQPL
ncbi:MAG: hypothetical protein HKN70_04865, partial [Gammaproteobacteria bacterium]|nr:hypothetical protein [Gammaproteobacteria bacterium]